MKRKYSHRSRRIFQTLGIPEPHRDKRQKCSYCMGDMYAGDVRKFTSKGE